MILTGIARLGADAVVRYTPAGEAVANLSLAFNYGKKDNDGKRPSQWIDASLWGKRVDALSPYLTKGTSVGVVLAEPHIETFEGRNGPGHKLVARVLEIEFAGGRRDDAQPTAPNQQQRPPSGAMNGGIKPATGGSGFDDLDDDIPF